MAELGEDVAEIGPDCVETAVDCRNGHYCLALSEGSADARGWNRWCAVVVHQE